MNYYQDSRGNGRRYKIPQSSSEMAYCRKVVLTSERKNFKKLRFYSHVRPMSITFVSDWYGNHTMSLWLGLRTIG